MSTRNRLDCKRKDLNWLLCPKISSITAPTSTTQVKMQQPYTHIENPLQNIMYKEDRVLYPNIFDAGGYKESKLTTMYWREGAS